MSHSSSCCCGGAGCSQCQEANTIYAATCADPGSLTTLRHLAGYDAQFCKRRLLPGTGGYLVARQTPNGWLIGFSTTPTIALEEFLAVQGVTFGQLLVQQSDNVMRAMNPPAVANLVLGTDAGGNAMWIPIPAATVPDPLVVNDLTVTNLATLNNVAISGGVNFTGLGTGTLVFTLGVDGSGNLIQGTPATTGVQVAMFYQQATSPGPGLGPNDTAAPGDMLTIGNLLFDSVLPAVPGGALITVTNSQMLTVVTDGLYVLTWGGEVSYGGGGFGTPSINLLINGMEVNRGYARGGYGGLEVNRALSVAGSESRRLVAGTTIQLQLDAASGNNSHTYEVRLTATRLGA